MSLSYHWRKALEARRILKQERESANPWADVANEERLAAADFADRCVGVVCIAVAIWLIASHLGVMA